ncbi:MAG TPA: vWA domain-containing protein [Planctomycetota bacterium]|nr:vWA domain-containing protein [Planctomycetota bacterium]
MGFLFPAMLAGLAALAVPLILHLIARQRFPEQPVPTLRLLQTERRTNAYAVRPVDLYQLLLRLLVVAAVVFAVSRPLVRTAAIGRPARNIVVVLDCSPSMLTDSGEKPDEKLFDRARILAAKLLTGAGPHDEVAFIEAGATARVAAPLSGDAAGAAKLASEASIQYRGGSSIGAAISQAGLMLAPRREVLSEIYVLSDMRRNLLDGWNERSRRSFAQTAAKLGSRLKVRFVDFASSEMDNIGFVDVNLTPGRLSTGADAHLIATVRNVTEKDQDVTVSLAVRQSVKSRRSVHVPANSEAVVDMAANFDAPVNTFCRLELSPSDTLDVDNSLTVPIRLDRRFEVMIIDGTEPKQMDATRPGQAAAPQRISGAKMLEFALNPAQFAASEGRSRSRNVVVKSVSLSTVTTAILGTSDLFILYNVSKLPQRTLEDLQELVANGRSVLLVPGEEVNMIEFRQTFIHTNNGLVLCPAMVDNAAAVAPGTRVNTGDVVHPIMEPFTDLNKGDLGSIHFKQLRGLQPAAGATVPFYVGTRPAAVEMRVALPNDTPEQRTAARRGRICVLGFGLEPEWSNLSLTRVFVPIVWRLVDHITGRLGSLPVDLARSGERFALDCSDFAPSASVALLCPDGKPLKRENGWPLELPLGENGSAVVSGLSLVGAYEITAQGQVEVDVKLADGRLVGGAAYTSAVMNAVQGRSESLAVRGRSSPIPRSEVAGADFGRAVIIKGVTVALANGTTLSCEAAGASLDAALAGRAGELEIAQGHASRKVSAGEVIRGRFADAVQFGLPPTGGRKSRFICVNPPAGESDTTPVSDETIASALGESRWEIVPAAKASLTELRAGELWWLITLLLVLAYFAEGAIGHWLSFRRESTRVGA